MNYSPARVLMRVDAGQGIGLGHLVRCLSLAQELTTRGAHVTVAMRQPSLEVISRISDVHAEVRVLSANLNPPQESQWVWPADVQHSDAWETLEGDEAHWDAVVVDHYRLDTEWETVVREHTKKLVVIDDLANRNHVADVLVDHNWYGPGTSARYDGLLNPDALTLLGPRFALLNPVYARARGARLPVLNPPKSVLINFGGTDVADQTVTAVTAVLNASDMQVEIVLGSQALLSPRLGELVAHSSRVNANIALPHLADVLARVDLVIGASGTGTWERLCMGVPSIVTTVSENQSGVTRSLAKAGVCTWLGVASRVGYEHYVTAIESLSAEGNPTPPPVVDGYGSARVALCVLDRGANQQLSRVADEDDDAIFVSGVSAADPDAGPKKWWAAAQEFKEHVASGDEVRVLCVEGVPIGTEIHLPSGERRRWIDRYVDGGAVS